MVLRLTTCSRNPQFRPPKPCLSNPTGLAVNLADDPKYADVVKQMKSLLEAKK